MIDQYLKEAQTEVRLGVQKKGHPFRYFSFATIGQNAVPEQRTVVLRQVTDDFKLRIYTDSRSDKIQQLHKNPRASLLFYHPKKLMQIKITGKVNRITDPDELKRYYSGVQPSSRKDYTSVKPPGTPIKNPDNVSYLEDQNYFTILEVIPIEMEFLQLKRPNHIRIAFTRENDEWSGQFINP